HIRIFDRNSAMVIDKPEPQLLQSESLITLKERLLTPILGAREEIDGLKKDLLTPPATLRSLKEQWLKLDSESQQHLQLIYEALGSLTGWRLPYGLLLMSDASPFPDEGRNIVVIGVNSPTSFRIQVFDDEGSKVYPHDGLWLNGGEGGYYKQAWTYLKNKLLPGAP